MPQGVGPFFGQVDLVTLFDEESGSCKLRTEEGRFRIGNCPPFLALKGNNVVDIEAYHYSNTPPPPTAPSTLDLDDDPLADDEAPDIRSFGQSIASSLMEERVVLDRAVKEMQAAGERISAAVGALETVYGPSVAAG